MLSNETNDLLAIVLFLMEYGYTEEQVQGLKSRLDKIAYVDKAAILTWTDSTLYHKLV